MKTLLAVAILFFTVPAGGRAASDNTDLLERCAAQLAPAEVLEGRFRQEKRVEFLDEPLTSTGTFQVSRAGELTWQVLEPAGSVMQVDGDRVTLDGERVRGHGMGRMMSLLMAGFMQGDFSGITRHFDVSGAVGQNGWDLTLNPRSSRTASALERVEITGHRYLQDLRIHENGGGQTAIRFSDVHPWEGDEPPIR